MLGSSRLECGRASSSMFGKKTSSQNLPVGEVSVDACEHAVLLVERDEAEERVEEDARPIELFTRQSQCQRVLVYEFQVAIRDAHHVALWRDLEHVRGVIDADDAMPRLAIGMAARPVPQATSSTRCRLRADFQKERHVVPGASP